MEVALHLRDVLRERPRGPGDDVGELPRDLAAIQPFRRRGRIGRAVDLLRHQPRKLRVAPKDLVSVLRTLSCGFRQPSKVLTDIPLSPVWFLCTDSAKFEAIVLVFLRKKRERQNSVAVHTYPNELPSC